MSNCITDQILSDPTSKITVCSNIDMNKCWKNTLYIMILAIILFIGHVVYNLIICNKFTNNSFALLLFFTLFASLYVMISALFLKVDYALDSSNKQLSSSKYDKGNYETSNDMRITLYIWLLSVIILIGSIIYFCIKNKTLYLTCASPGFPWKLTAILLVGLSITILKDMIQSVSRK